MEARRRRGGGLHRHIQAGERGPKGVAVSGLPRSALGISIHWHGRLPHGAWRSRFRAAVCSLNVAVFVFFRLQRKTRSIPPPKLLPSAVFHRAIAHCSCAQRSY